MISGQVNYYQNKSGGFGVPPLVKLMDVYNVIAYSEVSMHTVQVVRSLLATNCVCVKLGLFIFSAYHVFLNTVCSSREYNFV